MIELGTPLIKGGWCHIYTIKNEPLKCAKVLAPLRRFRENYPDPNELVRTKYGIDDFLEYEWNNYQKIMRHCPQELRPYFVTIHGVMPTTCGQQALVMDMVMDDLGQPAPNLVHNTRPLSSTFLNILETIRTQVFVAHAIDHFGIVRRNILVKSPDHPVIIDFQMGRERFRSQFWLRFPWFVRQKINRSFRKLYQELHFTLSN